jgi:hypothetical protein
MPTAGRAEGPVTLLVRPRASKVFLAVAVTALIGGAIAWSFLRGDIIRAASMLALFGCCWILALRYVMPGRCILGIDSDGLLERTSSTPSAAFRGMP